MSSKDDLSKALGSSDIPTTSSSSSSSSSPINAYQTIQFPINGSQWSTNSFENQHLILTFLALISSVGVDLSRKWTKSVYGTSCAEFDKALEIYKTTRIGDWKEDDLSKVIDECAKEIKM